MKKSLGIQSCKKRSHFLFWNIDSVKVIERMLLLTRSQESSFTWWVLLCCNSSQRGHLTIKYQKSKTASTSLQRFASAARAKELTYVSFQIDTEQIFVYLKEMRRMANGTQATLLMHIVTVNLATTHHLVEHVSSYISQEISCGHSATATICKSRRVVMWSPLNNIWTLCASSLIMPSAKKNAYAFTRFWILWYNDLNSQHVANTEQCGSD